ncbi:MAG: glycerophosphoryl diester phosphodiesterase [Gemmatimonadales bacterium]|nr:Glycerophosphodiester phosphodiesterase [bacterium HR33]GIW50904.1 MAG: glycerophosphoryl diester phosphodiesterase [Gemmatimonadales bacterium]
MRPIVIAHRGASAYEPENSLAAFRKAVRLGADGIELDVHATADGKLAVIHDGVLDGRAIGSQEWSSVRRHRLPNGEPVPALEEALDAIGEGVLVFVEVKALPPWFDQALLGALERAPAPGNCRVHAFDHRIVRRLRTKRPDLRCGVLSASYPVDPLRQVSDAMASDLWQEESMIDAELLELAARREISVYAWTVDSPERMRLLASWGVSGVCTNRPDVALEVLR